MKTLAVMTFAITLLLSVTLLLLLPTPPATSTAVPVAGGGAPGSVVIENVRLFDGTALHAPTTLVLHNGRVLGFGDAVERPAGARVLDGSGQTALPGLIDAHTHAYGQARRDASRFGVSTMLDMFTDPNTLADIAQHRDSYAATDTAALFSAGMLATVDGGHGTQFGVAVDTLSAPQQAAAWVAARKAEGSDYIKLVYIPGADELPSLDLATARAVIEAAHAEGLLAVAHISSQAAALDLLEAGIDGFVHIFADEPVSQAFVDRASAAGVFVVPTLSVIATADGQGLSARLLQDERISPLLNASQKASLNSNFGGPHAGFSLDTAIANVQRLHAEGVPMLAGSDAPNPGTAHGATLHLEMWLLTQAGLKPVEALAAATRIPADAFALHGRGALAPGARADIVLVEGDPTSDILATRAITAVFRNGHEVDRDAGAAALAGDPMPALLGDFEEDIGAPPGFAWAPTTDSIMGGSSEAQLSYTPDGANGSAGAMRVAATVYLDFPYPWAGAYLAVTPDGRTGDLSEYASIAFSVRGTPGDYRLMLFSPGAVGAPPSQSFEVKTEWMQVALSVADFAGFDAGQFTGLAITTPMEAGSFEFEIDNVRLLK